MGGRVCAALLLLVAALAACTSDAADRPPPAQAVDSCLPALVAGEDARGCRGVEVRFPNRKFVPQGLALAPGGAAYLSGYDHENVPGNQECQVARVDRDTGRVLEWVDIFYGPVPDAGEQFCRHGGGVAVSSHGLWVAGARQLWLLDPDALESGDPVLRVWRVDDGVRASTVAADEEELVIGMFRSGRRGHLLRFRYDDLLAPGAEELATVAGTAGDVEPSATRRVPSHVQGLAVRTHGVWLTRSTSYCGELVTPGGRRIPFVPGAEGIAFAEDGRIWVTSESGSRPYQRMGGRPDVPALSRIDPRHLDRTEEADCW